LDFRFIKNFVNETVRQFGTRDPFAIAEKACVSIVYESWNSVTIGEFERKTQTIFVNQKALTKTENAENLKAKIVAHELGHFFAADLRLNKKEEENFARAFAENLTEDNQ